MESGTHKIPSVSLNLSPVMKFTGIEAGEGWIEPEYTEDGMIVQRKESR